MSVSYLGLDMDYILSNGLRPFFNQSFRVNAKMVPQIRTYPSTPSYSFIHQDPTTLRHTVGDADSLET